MPATFGVSAERLRLHVRTNAPSVGLCKDELRCGRELLLDEEDMLATVKRAEAGCLVSTEVDLANPAQRRTQGELDRLLVRRRAHLFIGSGKLWL